MEDQAQSGYLELEVGLELHLLLPEEGDSVVDKEGVAELFGLKKHLISDAFDCFAD